MAVTFFTKSQTVSNSQPTYNSITFDVAVPVSSGVQVTYPYGEDLTSYKAYPGFSAINFIYDFCRSANKHTKVILQDGTVLPQLLDLKKAQAALSTLPRFTDKWQEYIPNLDCKKLTQPELEAISDKEFRRRVDIIITAIHAQTNLDRKTILTAVCQESVSGLTCLVIQDMLPSNLVGKVGLEGFSSNYDVEIYESGNRIVIKSEQIKLTYNSGEIKVLASANFFLEVVNEKVTKFNFSLTDSNPQTIHLFSDENIKKQFQSDISLVMYYYAAISGCKESYNYFMQQSIVSKFTEEQRKLITIQYLMNSGNEKLAKKEWQQIAPNEYMLYGIVYRQILIDYLVALMKNTISTGKEKCESLYNVLLQLVNNHSINKNLKQILLTHLKDLKQEIIKPNSPMVVSDNIAMRNNRRPIEVDSRMNKVFQETISLIINNNLKQFSDDLTKSLVEGKELELFHYQKHEEEGLEAKKMCVLL